MKSGKKGKGAAPNERNKQPVVVAPKSMEEAELVSLAHELSNQRRRAIEYLRSQSGFEPAEADARVRELLAPDNVERAGGGSDRIVTGLPQEATWLELERLAERDPAQMLRRWKEINQGALDELLSGHRAALTIARPSGETPWTRARFLATRAAFIEEWQPRGGIELSLIDVLAQAYTLYSHWLSVLVAETGMSNERRASIYSPTGKPEPPRVSEVETIELAASMVDRFHKLFMRTLRQLRDLRRYTPTVMIQNAGQVNLGNQSQQLNVTGAPPEGNDN